MLLACLLPASLPTCPAFAGPPPWWTERGVLTSGPGVVVNDYAAANAGQLKWMMTNAYDELEAALPGGAGAELAGLVAALPAGSDFAAVNAGQLKAAVARFHARFDAEGFPAPAGWTPALADDVDSAAVNVGQLKNAFAWDLTADGDANQLADWWQALWLPNCSAGASSDSDGDGWVNATELRAGTNPLEPDSDGDGLADPLDPFPRAATDFDADGLGDDWEQYWFQSLDRNGAADFDGDGATDAEEYAAGTNPTVADVGDREAEILLEIYLPPGGGSG